MTAWPALVNGPGAAVGTVVRSLTLPSRVGHSGTASGTLNIAESQQRP